MTHVAPSSDEVNNTVSHLQNQARLLHLNDHVFKITAPIYTIFRTLLHHDILNISIKFNFISSLFKSDARGERQQLVIPSL